MDRIPKRPSVASIIKNNKEFFSNFIKQLSNAGFALFKHHTNGYLELTIEAGRGQVAIEFRTRKLVTNYYYTINIMNFEEIILKGSCLPGKYWLCWTDLELEAYFNLFLKHFEASYINKFVTLDSFMNLYSEIEATRSALRNQDVHLVTGNCYKILQNETPYFSEYTSNDIAKWFGDNYNKVWVQPLILPST